MCAPRGVFSRRQFFCIFAFLHSASFVFRAGFGTKSKQRKHKQMLMLFLFAILSCEELMAQKIAEGQLARNQYFFQEELAAAILHSFEQIWARRRAVRLVLLVFLRNEIFRGYEVQDSVLPKELCLRAACLLAGPTARPGARSPQRQPGGRQRGDRNAIGPGRKASPGRWLGRARGPEHAQSAARAHPAGPQSAARILPMRRTDRKT